MGADSHKGLGALADVKAYARVILQGKELPHGDLMPAECQQGGILSKLCHADLTNAKKASNGVHIMTASIFKVLLYLTLRTVAQQNVIL